MKSVLCSLLTILILALSQTGCSGDPYDPATWIEKLEDNDPREVRRAVTELQRLKDPVAIGPLGETWRKENRPTSVLRVIIELAAGKDGAEPHWQDALPVLRESVSELDVGDPRSIENAIIGADALGIAGDKDSIQTLINAAKKPMPKLSKGQRARLAAIRALGKFGGEPRTVDALLGVLKADIKDQPVQLFAAAAEALGDARSPKAILPLLETLFKIPRVAKWCRTALIAIGKPVIPEATKIFEGRHREINALAKKYKFNIDCDRDFGPDTECIAPTNLEYKAAQLLGDLRASSTVPSLLSGLDKPAMAAFFNPADGAPGPSQHAAILDALKRIGKPSAASRVLTYATDPTTDDVIRPLAIDTYSYLTTDTEGLSQLAKIIKDDDAEPTVRLAAGVTYGRLVKSSQSYGPLTYMINRYKKEADKNEKKSKKAETQYQSAKKRFDRAQTAYERAKASGNERKIERTKRVADKARNRMEEKHQASSLAESQVSGYRNFQRTFEQNLVRAHVGVQCKSDPACYVGILDKAPDELGKRLSNYLDDWKDWTQNDKAALKIAAIERALLELAKMGERAQSVIDKILAEVESTERVIRQGCLLVMMQTAQLPCKKCVDRLNEIIDQQKEQTTLRQLTDEARAARNYFLWAGT
ncbi:MAG: hypothetical protein MJE77_23180 [Proteobacteria bacterium]|nr:hypothetical protein [Pseudomonadota bacterium]